VRAGLDEEIKGLGNELKFLNIIVVPFLFAAVVLMIAVFRKRRLLAAANNKRSST
jgi:hypothetical protein